MISVLRFVTHRNYKLPLNLNIVLVGPLVITLISVKKKELILTRGLGLGGREYGRFERN